MTRGSNIAEKPTLAAQFGASGALFGLRTTAAALAALWLGMWLQFDTPRWAAWTAMALALPTRGLVATKGMWRAGGTILGLAAGLAGVAIFSQSAIAMGLFLAAWFAFNAYVGGRLPGFAAYGAALSGLTTGLVVVLSEASPLTIFNISVARAADILLGLACAYVASAFAEMLQGPRPATAARPAPAPNLAQVAGNTVRVFVAVGLAWFIWMATAWPSGGLFAVFAGVVALFLGTLPDPDRRSADYLWGVILGQFLGIFVKYALLNAPSSFGLLAAILAPFLFIGAVGMTDQRTAGTAVGYNLSFLLAVDPANPMQYDLAASLNEAAAIFAGIAFGMAAYRIVLPERIWRAAR
ncbi:FUSC family protein [Methylocella silvestris]|uniref:FUSC family protein n=1 Tax=Methylocella silvestris TaxID=199596 RepID=A0A2J7TCE7_METSI|nr:FUSC family protein [Methylocella silvestris]PNG24438.1 hypothetical protein CR492_18625 [Methylocella silvestris]